MKSNSYNFVIILGAARSGTTLLANLLKKDERVCYIGEPKYIWKYKNFSAGHDRLTKNHITPEIRNYITHAFQAYLADNGGEILLEKTPSNTLRFEFVYNLFPKAKFIHIIRNGIPVAKSAKKRWSGEYTRTEKMYKSHLKEIGTATKNRARKRWFDKKARFADLILDLNYTIPLYLNNAGLLNHSIWGPVYPGMRRDYKQLELIEVCALQWKHCVESVLNFKNSPDFEGNYFEIRYEDIVTGNTENVSKMFEFAGIDFTQDTKDDIKSIAKNYFGKPVNSESDTAETNRILKHCKSTLTQLGYL